MGSRERKNGLSYSQAMVFGKCGEIADKEVTSGEGTEGVESGKENNSMSEKEEVLRRTNVSVRRTYDKVGRFVDGFEKAAEGSRRARKLCLFQTKLH